MTQVRPLRTVAFGAIFQVVYNDFGQASDGLLTDQVRDPMLGPPQPLGSGLYKNPTQQHLQTLEDEFTPSFAQSGNSNDVVLICRDGSQEGAAIFASSGFQFIPKTMPSKDFPLGESWRQFFTRILQQLQTKPSND